MIENQSDNIDNKENDLSDQDNALEDSSSEQELTTENNELSSQKKEEINTEELISKFDLYPSTLTDEIQAGGRINLMIGRSLTDKIRNKLEYKPSELFIRPENPKEINSSNLFFFYKIF